MAKRELNIKPSCAHEIHGLGSKMSNVLWEKLELLLDDPHPDGKLKKKLAGKEELYRLRVGGHRVFYSYGSGWVRLLAVRDRKEAYGKKNEAIVAETPAALPTADPALPDDDEDLAARPKPFVFEASSPVLKPTKTPLPHPLTAEWLQTLQVPPQSIGHLLLCETEEQLLASHVPDAVLSRVVENLYPKPLVEVLAQPDLLVGGVGDLVQFQEGTLLSFLLRLDAEQEKLVHWALKGPTLVRGGAGTGKSTVALYRVRALLQRPKAAAGERLLFATYTTTLKAASEQLLGQLLSAAQQKQVRVATCDQIAREVVASHRKLGEVLPSLLPLLREVRASWEPPAPTSLERKLRKAALAKLGDTYLLDEFSWVIEGRGLRTRDEYLGAPRPGRSVAFGPKLREVVWGLYEAFSQRIAKAGKETFAGLRQEALSLALADPERHGWDHVLVDEAQDLTPVALRLMAHLARSAEGLFFAADDKQTLYARGYGYASVDPRLNFKGRTAVLERNYRSTEEIDRAAFSLLTPEEGQALEPSISPHHGPKPLVLRGIKPGEEPRWAVKFLREMSRYLRVRPGAAAVLVPDRATGELMATGMTKAGLEAIFYPSGQVDLASSAVKVMTVHSAKGLEFPSVVVVGLGGADEAGGTEQEAGEQEEADRRLRRLLYVAVTRAMQGVLVLLAQGKDGGGLGALDPVRWTRLDAEKP